MAPISEFGFNEGAGLTAGDSSGNGYSLTASSAVTSWTTGKDGSGATQMFTGVFGPSFTLASWTVMFWLKINTLPADTAGILYQAEGSVGNVFYLTLDSTGTLLNWTNAAPVYSTSTIPTGTWVHVAVTWGNLGTTIYLDGVADTTGGAGVGITFDSGHDWYIASDDSRYPNGFDGVLDDLRLFDGQLSQGEVASWMNTPSSIYTTDRCESGIANAGGGAGTTYSPGGNEPNMAFDNNIASNWLRVRTGGNVPPVWLQYDFGIGYERKIARYTITTTSDTEAHDPMSWTLLASNTGVFGGEEVMVDSQTDGQLPSARGTTKTFDCSNPPSTAYRFYRLVVAEQKNTGIVSAMTIAEMEMMELAANSTGPLPTPQVGGNTELPLPISSYNFAEQSGTTTADRTGNGYTLTTSGSGWVGVDEDNMVGAKEDFNGKLGPNVLQQEWTVMAWVKWNAMAVPYMAIVSNSSSFYLELWGSGSRIECWSGVSGHPSSGEGIVPSGTWAHVAATRRADGTSIVFVNGEPVVTGKGNAANFGVGTWYIGGANSPSYVLDGAVSNVYVFDSALSSIEIRAWMNVYPIAPPMTLLAAYGFNEADGSALIKDYSGNEVTATAYGVSFANGPLPGTRAVAFAGTGQYVHIPRAATEPDSVGVTVMCWAKGPVDMDYIVKPRGNNSTRMGIGPNWRARWKDDLHYTDSGSGVDTSQWHHYCVSEADDRWLVFIDGQYYDGGSRSVDPGTPAPWENYPWCIGDTLGTGLGDSKSGQTVAEVRIFKGYIGWQWQIDYWMNTPVSPQGRKVHLAGRTRALKLGNSEKLFKSP